jgi:hypothetical protein
VAPGPTDSIRKLDAKSRLGGQLKPIHSDTLLLDRGE